MHAPEALLDAFMVGPAGRGQTASGGLKIARNSEECLPYIEHSRKYIRLPTGEIDT